MNFLDKFSKNTQISNVTNIRPVGAELFLADGQTGKQGDERTDRQAGRRTDRHPKLTVTLRDFMNAAETTSQNLISLDVGAS